jgi:parvulin-like peptidyl-prolyl isomerase
MMSLKGTIMKYLSSLLACSLVVALGCSKTPQAPVGSAIKVNGTWIKTADIERTAEMLRQQLMRFAPQEGMAGVSDDIRKKTAKQLVAQQLILEEAVKRKLTCGQALVDSVVLLYTKQMGGDSAFAQLLARSGQSEADFRTQISQGYVIDTVMKILMGKLDTVSETDCKQFYDKNPGQFMEQGKVRARHILIALGKDTSTAARARLQQKAAGVLAEARGGKDFAALARKYSADPTAKDGGDIGWFKRGDLQPALEEPLFSLKVGDVTDIIASQIGFHILQKTEVQDSTQIPYDKIAWKISKKLEIEKEQVRMEQVVDSLIAKADVVYADTTYKP